MVCIYCRSRTKVVNSRPGSNNVQTWRRRSCTSCKSLFTSIEKPDLEHALAVLSAEGTLEGFSRDRLLVSLFESLKHRPRALEEATALTDTIIAHMLKRSYRAALKKNELREKIASTLKRFDQPAYVHYAAFHKT